MSRFLASPEGVVMDLNAGELAVLAQVPGVLAGAGVTKDDPSTERLHPVLYPDDPAASREFERLAAKERIEAASADRESFAETLRRAAAGRMVLTSDEAGTWARVLGETRIVLAARKGLFEAGLPDEFPADPEVALVLLLGHMQEELVTEMLRTMEDVGDGSANP